MPVCYASSLIEKRKSILIVYNPVRPLHQNNTMPPRRTRAARSSSRRPRSRNSASSSRSPRRLASKKPARQWVKVKRAPGPGINFLITTWKPLEALTSEERAKWEEEQLKKKELATAATATTPTTALENTAATGDSQPPAKRQRTSGEIVEGTATTVDVAPTDILSPPARSDIHSSHFSPAAAADPSFSESSADQVQASPGEVTAPAATSGTSVLPSENPSA